MADNGKKNYYEILGVSKTATQDEIKSAYKKLVKQYHPDLHPDDPTAAEKFKEINEANETLSDEQKRKQYDFELEHPGMGGQGGFSGAGFSGFGGFEDIFSSFFSGGFSGTRQGGAQGSIGDDIQKEMNLSFMDSAKGCVKELSYMRSCTCPSCRGNGSKNGTAYSNCTRCNGTGQIQITQNTMFGRSVRIGVCPECGGKGKKILEKCVDCKGRGTVRKEEKVTLNIPAGVDNQSYIRKRGYGEAGENGGQSGDLIVVFRVERHRILERKNLDLYVELPVSFETAALGGTVKVPTVDDAVDYFIPEGTQNGTTFTLRGKGLKTRNGTGNLYVRVLVEVPTHLSKEQKQKIADTMNAFDLKQCDKMRRYDDDMERLYGVKPYAK